MGNWKTFTSEELRTIRSSPYVKSATAKMIRFTVEFKEEFWRRYSEECQSPPKIMKDMGFDTEVIGERRIAGILMHIREQAQAGEGFRDVRKAPESQVSVADMTPARASGRLQHKVAYLEQEVEFIKKTIIADNKARRKK